MSEGTENEQQSIIEQGRRPNPEQASPNLTETSKAFLRRWHDEVILAFPAGLSTVLAGLNIASEHYGAAVFNGLTVATLGAIAVLKRKSEAQGRQSLEDQVSKSQNG